MWDRCEDNKLEEYQKAARNILLRCKDMLYLGTPLGTLLGSLC